MGLGANEHYGHETAALYDPARERLFLESNPLGIGPTGIATYFKGFANQHSQYSLRPLLDEDAAARARRYQTIRGVTIRAAVGQITEADRRSGFSASKTLAEGVGAGYVNIEFAAERPRGRSLDIGGVWDALTPFLGNARGNNIINLSVKGRENDDQPLEVIDLIQHFEKGEVSLEVDGRSRNIPHTRRWEALTRMRAEFRP